MLAPKFVNIGHALCATSGGGGVLLTMGCTPCYCIQTIPGTNSLAGITSFAGNIAGCIGLLMSLPAGSVAQEVFLKIKLVISV